MLQQFKISWWAPKTHVFWIRARNGRSRSSKVVDFSKSIARMQLHISDQYVAPFKDIAGFLVNTATRPIFHAKFGSCSSWARLQILESEKRRLHTLIIRVNQPLWQQYDNSTLQTDRQTYNIPVAISHSELHTSRRKNRKWEVVMRQTLLIN